MYSPVGRLRAAQLPDARVEVEAIARHFPKRATTWIGADATETKLKHQDLRSYSFLHFATHGLLASDASGYAEPGLLFARSDTDDGVLTTSEAQALKLKARIAVLSACDTGNGELVPGEGALSVSRAFLIAGAESVVVSLWPVDSVATKELMVSFYAHLAKAEQAGRG